MADFGIRESWFSAFLALDADRHEILLSALSDSGCEAKSQDIAGARFITVFPQKLDRNYRVKFISAHYDRVPGTVGALDNSAACYQLWRFICSGDEKFNTICLFTDMEEIQGDDLTRQGSFLYGTELDARLKKQSVFLSLDITGRGDTLILSKAAEKLMGEQSSRAFTARKSLELSEEIFTHLSSVLDCRQLEIPFGEDLGFMLASLPAMCMTVLPKEEADDLENSQLLPPWASLRKPGSKTPATWKYLHSPDDTPRLYTKSAFELMDRVLKRLGAWRAPLYL